MSSVTTTIEPVHGEAEQVRQYGKRGIFAVWAAVTATMTVFGWVVAPWLADHLSTRDPFVDALLICYDVGLVLMLTLVAVLLRRERGSLRWHDIRDGLWLRAPRDPKSGRRGGKVWLWVIPFTVLSGVINALGIDPDGPVPRDLPVALETHQLTDYFHANWWGFALVVANALLAPIVEEIVFRGFMLPRSRDAFGRGDVITNGVLFTLYHLHQPWSMPAVLLDGTLTAAYPTKRFRSTWIAIVAHTAPSVVIIAAVLMLVV